jgi:hypothetical protein
MKEGNVPKKTKQMTRRSVSEKRVRDEEHARKSKRKKRKQKPATVTTTRGHPPTY